MMLNSRCLINTLVLFCVSFLKGEATDKELEYVDVPNSCVGLEDGSHVLKLLEGDEYPLVNVDCNNNYMIINIDKDSNLKEYFSSLQFWHYAIMGPNNNDHVNWHDWYLPSSQENEVADKNKYKFLYSKSCDICDITYVDGDYKNSEYVPYMTGNLFGCFWPVIGKHDSDMDWDTYECRYQICDDINDISPNTSIINDNFNCDYVPTSIATADELSQYIHALTGACNTFPQDARFNVANKHYDCISDSSNRYYKPSIGTDNRNCVCVKPSKKYEKTFSITKKEFENNFNQQREKRDRITSSIFADASNDDEIKRNKNKNSQIFYLYQNDFESGTYRITEPGTYIIMEDIEFNFNKGISNEDGSWLPHDDQTDNYIGAASDRDGYFMGFFAGITVESNNVIIDLNDNKLSQNIEFYFQQRWFALIELASQPFMPGQGPGMFGALPVTANNVEIKNGILGLTSHHGIHGNKNNNINIHNIEIKNFETHGIQLNGFNNVVIKDVIVHDSSQMAFLRGEYFHARLLLPRLRQVIDAIELQELNYQDINPKLSPNDLNVDIKSIYDKLKDELDIAFDYVRYLYNLERRGNTIIDFERYFENNNNNGNRRDHKEYLKIENALSSFIYLDEEDDDLSLDSVTSNGNGLPYGTAIYGIFLSLPGANVFSMGNSKLQSSNLILENIKIHGLRHKMNEYLRFQDSIQFTVNPFNGVFDMNIALSDITNVNNSTYVGNTLTDAYIALKYLSEDWGLLGLMNIDMPRLVDWALQTNDNNEKYTLGEITNYIGSFVIHCNSDVMAHSGKGTIGLRLDGINNVKMNNIEIYNLYDYTKYGSDVCGDYRGITGDTGHFLQNIPMQYGFSGNMMHGIHIIHSNVEMSNINIHDIGSSTGLAHGISVYKGSNIIMNDDIIVSNLLAGFQLDLNTFEYAQLPNAAPEACGIKIHWEDDSYGSMGGPNVTTNNSNNLNINNECIIGHVGCFNDQFYGATTIGTYSPCNNNYREYGILNKYKGKLDARLLNLKDISNQLNDFEKREDVLLFDESYRMFPDKNVINNNNNNNNYNNKINQKKSQIFNVNIMFIEIGWISIIIVVFLVFVFLVRQLKNKMNDNHEYVEIIDLSTYSI